MIKFFRRYKNLVKIAEEHHVVSIVKHNQRHLGIILSFVSWLLIAFYSVSYTIQNRHFCNGACDPIPENLSKAFFEFVFFHLGMFCVYAPLCFFTGGLKYIKSKKPKLMFWRTLIAVIGMWTYSLSRIWSDVFDNSLLYTTDAAWILLILFLLGIRISKLSILGIILSFCGILYVYLITFEYGDDFRGATLGALSGLVLSLTTITTSYLVKKDPPLRIGFYHSTAGIILSLILAVIFGLSQNWGFPNFKTIINMSFSGFFFGFAIFCLWEAFFYVETYIIGTISYALPVLVIILAWILDNEPIRLHTIIGMTIVILGSLLTIFNSFITDKKTKHYTDGGIVKK